MVPRCLQGLTHSGMLNHFHERQQICSLLNCQSKRTQVTLREISMHWERLQYLEISEYRAYTNSSFLLPIFLPWEKDEMAI